MAQEVGGPLASRCLLGTPRPDSEHRLQLGGLASRPGGVLTRPTMLTVIPYTRRKTPRPWTSLSLAPNGADSLLHPAFHRRRHLLHRLHPPPHRPPDSASVDSEASGLSLISQSEVRWLLPSGPDSRLQLCRFDLGEEDDLMAVCRHTRFRFGAQRGQGWVDAAQTGRQWSPRCRRRLLERVEPDCLAEEQEQ